MTTANLDGANLTAVTFGGLINEDVMQEVWDISSVPLPFTERIGSDSVGNAYAEWTQDTLADPDITNATIDGADAGTSDHSTGARVGNHCQIPDKVVKVSTRARSSNTIGFSDTLEYQVMRRQQELRRDVEAISLEPQASLADTGAAAGKLGGFPSWLTTTTARGALGADGGFDGAGIVDAPTNGTVRANTLTLVRNTAIGVWKQGGNPSVMMSVPDVIASFSSFMFSNDAQVATLQKEAAGTGAAVAIASVGVFYTDFGITLEMVPNRLQQTYNSGTAANMFIFDPEFVQLGFLTGYRVDELAKTGTADNRQMLVDVTLKVLAEEAHGVIADIDHTAAVTA